MVIEGVYIGLLEPRDPFVFPKNWPELSFSQVANTRALQREATLEFVVIQHRNFYLAAPTPESFHAVGRLTEPYGDTTRNQSLMTCFSRSCSSPLTVDMWHTVFLVWTTKRVC